MLLSASRKSLCLPIFIAFQCVNDSDIENGQIISRVLFETVIYLGLSSRRASRDHTRRSAGRLQPSLLDLASYGACIAHELLHAWWAFTLHLFTFAVILAVYFLLRFPSDYSGRTLSGILPCEARTFLML